VDYICLFLILSKVKAPSSTVLIRHSRQQRTYHSQRILVNRIYSADSPVSLVQTFCPRMSPAFGFSVGDIIAGVKLLTEIINAFKETGGAKSKYGAELFFVTGLKATFEQLKKFVDNNRDGELPQDLDRVLETIAKPWQEFKEFLQDFEDSLGESSTRSKLRRTPRMIQYTIKSVSGKIEKLKQQISQPLQVLNALLALQVM
jgi:hypothetical protein